MVLREKHKRTSLLRFSSCFKCGNHVTGSASRSRNGNRHFYYRCKKCKNEKYRGETGNEDIKKLLGAIQIKNEVQLLYATILDRESIRKNRTLKRNLCWFKKLSTLNERNENHQNSFLSKDLDAKDYTELKKRLENMVIEVKEQMNN